MLTRAALLVAWVLVWAAPAPAVEPVAPVEPAVAPADLEAPPESRGGPEAAALPAGPSTPSGPVYASEIERAWFAPAPSLERRVSATRRVSLQYGVWNLDAAAQAVVAGGFAEGPLERARAAVRLAPDLPAVRMELAKSIWLHGDSPISALRAAWEAALAATRHVEASVWFAGSGLTMLAVALMAGGLLCIAVAGVFALSHATHDLGDLLARAMPSWGRAALIGALLLAPLALGEGWLGVVLLVLALAAAYGSGGQRVVLLMAGGAVIAGAFPVANWAGAVLTGFARDPVAESAFSTAAGSALETDVVRLTAAADSDPLAARALARRARRTRSLSVADAHYQALLAKQPNDWVIANNAANVRLNLGHMETALDLYQRAAKRSDSPVVYYNLAQAYGRAFQVEELAETLEHAQALDGALVAELTALQGSENEGFVVDLPLPSNLLWTRLAQPREGRPLAAELRRPLAPGRLGASPLAAGAGIVAAVLLGWAVGGRFRPSRLCSRCGRRQCPRCEPESGGGSVCSACRRLFYQPEETDRALRVERMNELRDRERRIGRLLSLVGLLVPGTAGFLARRPLQSLLASFFFALAVVTVVWRRGVVPDPLVAGGAAPFVFLHLAVLAGLFYAALVAASLAARRRL